MGLDPGPWAAHVAMVYVAIAVAIPSAPGFFGVYHAACREALVPLGVAPETAIAMGTLAHLGMWVTFIATGLLCLRATGARLRDVLRGSASTPTG